MHPRSCDEPRRDVRVNDGRVNMRWRWLLLCACCRRGCCYWCTLCTVSVAAVLAIIFWLGGHGWLLTKAGLTFGDEMEADIPLETQGQVHFVQLDKRQEPSSRSPPSPPNSSPTTLSSLPSLPSKDSSDHYCPTHSTDNIIFFIRLPKCASTSFVDLLRQLSKLSDFYLEFNPSGAYNWKDDEKLSVARQCFRKLFLKEKLVYARHFYFVNFTAFGVRNFTYVTIIRNPIDRVVSSYLYYHFSTKKHIQNMLNSEHKNESLSTCLRHQHEGCTHNLVTKYFCGHEYWCKSGNKRALETAKRNLRNHFAVVGIMEDIELSMRLMRHILPQFFAASSKSDDGGLTLPSRNRNERRVSLTEEERLETARTNAADMELYAYAVQLLHDQASQCGLTQV